MSETVNCEGKSVVILDESDAIKFENKCEILIKSGYTIHASSCGFVNSAEYDFCPSYQAVFVKNDPEEAPDKKELLPCPFCGDKAELRNAGGSIEACCTGIGCYAKRRCSSPLQGDAIAKWNERI